MNFLGKRNCFFTLIALLGLCQIVLAESTDPVYRQAVGAFAAQNWTKAAEQFKSVYSCNPTASEAEDSLFFWGESLLQLGQYDKSQECFGDYLRQWPGGRRGRAAQFRRAESLMLGGRYKEAKYQIKRFETLYPSDPLLEYTTSYLAEIAIAEDKLAEAEELFADAAQKYPNGHLLAANRLGLARVQAGWGKLEKACDTLKPLVEARDADDRTYREAVALRSSLLARLGRTASGEEIDTPAAEEELRLEDLVQEKTAEDRFAASSLPLRADDPSLWTNRRKRSVDSQPVEPMEPAESFRAQKPSIQAATVVIDDRSQQDQKSELPVKAMWRRARYFERTGKLDPALTAYEDLYQKYPDTPEADEARLAAARIYTKLKQDRCAKELYNELFFKANQRGSLLDQATVFYQAAQAQERIEATAGQDSVGKSEAIDMYKRLFREFPDSPVTAKAACRLAQHAVDQKDFNAARKYLEKSLASKETLTVSRSLQLVWRIGAVEQDWALVRRAAERLLLLEEQREGVPGELGPMARFWIAEADYRTGQYRSARHRFEALADRIAVQPFPWKGLVALRTAQSLAQLSDFSAARRVAEKASVAFPDFADRYEFDYLIGQCAFAQGEYTTARAAFGKVAGSPAAQQTEVALLAREGIASTFFAQEDYDSAIAEFAKLQSERVPVAHRAKALHYTALCYERLGKKSHAETLYQRLVDRYPGYPLR